MTSAKHLHHQILDTRLSHDKRAQLRCQLAKQLEDAGNYEAAREAMGEHWLGVGQIPMLDGLAQISAGDVLLRIGVLSGWIGSTKQIEGAQEAAKNLISLSLDIFESLGDVKKAAEARTELGYCYWREGAFDEARIVLREALSRLDDCDGDLKAVALLRYAAVDKVDNRLNDALQTLNSASALFEASSNHALKGRFHNEFGTVLKNLGVLENRSDYVDRALIEYAAASFHFEEAGHPRYQACVENNLAMLFLRAGNSDKAHEHLDRAQALFTTLRDSVHLAQVDETRAKVLLVDGRASDAEKLVSASVQTLEKGGEQSLLAEALITRGIALAALDHHDEAREVLERAIDVAETAGDPESGGRAALTLIEELGEHLPDELLCDTIDRARTLLAKTADVVVTKRLAFCACRVLLLIHPSEARPDWTHFSLKHVMHKYEAHFIKLALRDAGGKVRRAAYLLGLPGHQSLFSILNGRQRDLERPKTESSGLRIERASDKKPICDPQMVDR